MFLILHYTSFQCKHDISILCHIRLIDEFEGFDGAEHIYKYVHYTSCNIEISHIDNPFKM